MKRLVALVIVLLCAHSTAGAQTSRIVKLKNSRHDFSAAGTATIKAQSEDSICVFCHTPHNAQPAAPLWNKKLTQGQTYNVYQSSTLGASVAQNPRPATVPNSA